MNDYIVPFAAVGRNDIESVGGKNASLGEMIRALSGEGIDVPGGFAITSGAYRDFLAHDGLDRRIYDTLAELDVDDVSALRRTGAEIRRWILERPFPAGLRDEIAAAYEGMQGGADVAVAVRSSATAEDLPEASFAGQQDTRLNIRGLAALVEAVHSVYSSLFTDRAIAYRTHHGFDHANVSLSVGVQEMVRADRGASGVLFTLDTDSGFRDVVLITAGYGLGETLVQGSVNPDEFYVYKPALEAGRHAILRRTLGTKAIKMVYA
ncbi:MAG: phosphoenolpyruvate synthase, partial [Gemmatimonadota bacterium]